MSETKHLHIAGLYALGAALIGGLFLLFIFFMSQNNPDQMSRISPDHPKTNDTNSGFEITHIQPIQQPVNGFFIQGDNLGDANRKFETNEETTFEITVRNESNELVTISKVQFVPSRVHRWFERLAPEAEIGRTLMLLYEIDHREHISFPFSTLSVDQTIGTEMDLTIGSGRSKTFTLWFQAANRKHGNPIDVHGILTLETDKKTTSSKPLILKIRPDALQPFSPPADNADEAPRPPGV